MNMMMVAYLIFDNPKKLLLSDCAILTVQEGSTFWRGSVSKYKNWKL